MTASNYLWNPENAIPSEIKVMLNGENLTSKSYVIIFLEIISLLKKQRRTGWVDFNIKECESISDHMYRMGIISTLLPEKVVNILSPEQEEVALNKSRCVQIAVVHDMAEALVGDITPKDPVPKAEKHYRELSTMDYLTETLIKPYNEKAAKEIKELWLEYEDITTIEARYVKDIDKFEMVLQAFEYEKAHNKALDLSQFFDSVASIKTTEIKELANEVMTQRARFWGA